MATYLMTWNPDIWDEEIAGTIGWSTGQRKTIIPGDRLFLMRQVREPRGVCGAGFSVSNVVEDTSGEYKSGRYVRFQVDTYRDSKTEKILTYDVLEQLNIGVERPMKWGIQSSGTEIPPLVAQRLEEAWSQLCGQSPYPDDLPTAGPSMEGARQMVWVNAYERDRKNRDHCIAVHGTQCSVCEMSFGSVYGKVAEGFIHVHHLHPLSEVKEAHHVDPVKDLRPVCPNCHAVLHRRNPVLSIEELRELMLNQGQS